LGGYLYSITIVLNLWFLPWGSGSFGNRIRGAANNMVNNCDDTLAMFSRFYDLISRQKGVSEVDRLGDPGRSHVWQLFLGSDYLTKAGAKVGLCRWFQCFVRMRRFCKDWHSALVAILRAAAGDSWARNVLQSEQTSCDGGLGSSSKSAASSAARALRGSCVNSMHFAARFLVNPLHERICQIIACLTEYLQKWYHIQAKTLNDLDKGAEWAIQQLRGGFFMALSDTVKQLGVPSLLEKMGFEIKLDARHLAM